MAMNTVCSRAIRLLLFILCRLFLLLSLLSEVFCLVLGLLHSTLRHFYLEIISQRKTELIVLLSSVLLLVSFSFVYCIHACVL